MPTLRVLIDDAAASAGLAPGDVFPILGEEARHLWSARRAQADDRLELLDAAGLRADARIEGVDKGGRDGLTVRVRLLSVHREPPPRPAVHVFAAPPKGDRLAAMIEELSQVGAASWTPLRTAHGVVDPRETKLDRLRRVARESVKQCGRAHAMEIREPVDLSAALRTLGAPEGVAPGARALVAHPGGAPMQRRGAASVALFIGPEGGWSDAELADMASRGVERVGLGPHILRIGTAAVVGCALAVLAEAEPDPQPGPSRGAGDTLPP